MSHMMQNTAHGPTNSYFERIGPASFAATKHVGGGWDPEEQHIAPALGLLAHCMEVDRRARGVNGLQLTRVSYDILGTFAIGQVGVVVTVLRPGRTIELVEARLSHDGRDVVIARGWFMQTYNTTAIQGVGLNPVGGPGDHQPWNGSQVWPGGFIASLTARRTEVERGRAMAWLRTDTPLVRDEPVSPTATFLGLVDVMNGVAARAENTTVAFPNLDLTAHFFREPRLPWVGLHTSVSFGPTGVGLTTATIHDDDGPVGVVAQTLTVRPM